jgi:hypothetical protein
MQKLGCFQCVPQMGRNRRVSPKIFPIDNI